MISPKNLIPLILERKTKSIFDGGEHYLKGGSFLSSSNRCRSAYRKTITVLEKQYSDGFRILMEIIPAH
jgi:hypothetical protein